MKEKFESLRLKMEHWMIGRYGTDEFSRFLFVIGIIMMLVYSLTGVGILSILSWIILIYGYYRCLSKKIIHRSRERDFYLRATEPVRKKCSLWKRMWKDRNSHRYFKCPKCKKMVRVPKGKGRIRITCTSCGNEIIKKT